MKSIENFLDGYSISEKRSALYYLSRYMKQAKDFEKYKKDIFEDGIENDPGEKIKLLTLEIMDFIETTAKKKASEFSEGEYHFWMDNIADIEENIDKKPSEEQIQKALIELDKFEIPKKNKTDY